MKQKPKKKPGILFDAKEQWPVLDLIDEIKSPTRRVAWLLMVFTGLRAINVRELDWKDIDLAKATIRIADLKNHQERIFPIADAVVDALKSLPHRTGWVFPAELSQGISKTSGT